MLQSVIRRTKPASIPSSVRGGPQIDAPDRLSSGIVEQFSFDSRIVNPQNGRDAVLESLISETHFASARTVVIASWTNGLGNPEIALGGKTVHALVPAQPVMMTTMRRWINSTACNGETLRCTEELFASLAIARNAFELFSGEAKKIGYVRAGILHRSVLSGTWRFAAERALDAITAQAEETVTKLPDIYRENGQALVALIGDVKAGGMPCLDAVGRIRMPDLPNQRRSTRLALLENCLVETSRKTFKAFARDVCAGGLGLSRVPAMPSGMRVTITLPSGRSFKGCVAWYKNAAAGIRFDTPLGADDSLLGF